jgi:hypothetical protein
VANDAAGALQVFEQFPEHVLPAHGVLVLPVEKMLA